MKLYYAPGTCALSPHIVALEAGYRPELVKVNLKDKTIEGGGDYRKVNARGYVPALETDGGLVLTEGPAIVQYLADHKPEAGLAPANGTDERYRLQEWLNFISTEIHKAFSPLFNKELAPETHAFFTHKLEDRFGWVAGQLEGKTFLMGDRFSVADAYLFTVLRWGKGMHIELGRWPALKDYFERIAARPKTQEAMAAQGIKA